MTPPDAGPSLHLADVDPAISGDEIAAELVPPRQFASASFDSYVPDPDYPSQAGAVEALRTFAGGSGEAKGGLFRRRRSEPIKPGVYLDGGFGVGKTHLLAALFNQASGRIYYGTFIEYTALIGALGFQQAVDMLRGAKLVCIDEFELDDPGDTMMMTRMLKALAASGTRIAATSNTPPAALGEGRFAAADFLREIQAMSDDFDVVRIDGLDYRRRDTGEDAAVLAPDDLATRVAELAASGATVSVDRFDDLIAHLATVHPSKYVKLLDGVDALALEDVSVLHDQTPALRLVAFIDRVYDAQIPVLASGVPLSEVYDDDMRAGGYRKKYLRSVSRLVALTTRRDDV